jgi:hypothetical protein
MRSSFSPCSSCGSERATRRCVPQPSVSARPQAPAWKQLLPIDLPALFRPLLRPYPRDLLWLWFRCTMHDLYAQAEHILCPLLAPALVTGIHPQMREARKAIFYTLQQQLYPVLIGNLGTVNLGLQDQPFRIHEQVSLPAANLFPTILSPRFSAHPGSLCRLGIHYSSAGLRVST